MNDKSIQVNCPYIPLHDEIKKNKNSTFMRSDERHELKADIHKKENIYGKGKNYSHQWILQDGRVDGSWSTETMDRYQYRPAVKVRMGPRQEMLERFFWKESTKSLMTTLSNPKESTESCSEYNSNYVLEGFELKDWVVTNKEKFLRFPLYGDASKTITYHTLNDRNIKKNLIT